MSVLRPATGTCRWLSDTPNGNRRILINGKEYELQVTPGKFVLHRVDDRGNFTRYVIDTTWPNGAWTCSCPDASYHRLRRYCCKHIQALRAALRALPF